MTTDHEAVLYWRNRALLAELRDTETAIELSKAEARIRAVRDVLEADEHATQQMGTLGRCNPDVPAISHAAIRHALDS